MDEELKSVRGSNQFMDTEDGLFIAQGDGEDDSDDEIEQDVEIEQLEIHNDDTGANSMMLDMAIGEE